MLIAEVGLNYLGDEKLAMKYVEKLATMEVDGITFQVPEERFFQNPKNKYLKLRTECILDVLHYTKSLGVKFGVAISNVNLVEKFKNYETDFYKVLSTHISEEVLIKELVNNTNKQIFN